MLPFTFSSLLCFDRVVCWLVLWLELELAIKATVNLQKPCFTTMSNSNTNNPMNSSSSPPTGSPPPATSSAASRTNVASLASTTATLTITETPPQNDEVLRLTLRARPSVTWDEEVVNNEGLGRKSSKRCCIFHKQRAFGESSTDSSDIDSDGSSSSENNDGDAKKKVTRRKKGKPKGIKGPSSSIPDHQRFHA